MQNNFTFIIVIGSITGSVCDAMRASGIADEDKKSLKEE